MKSDITKLEYEASQDSAEHYNTMIWTLISVGVGFSLLVIKFALVDVNMKDSFLINKLSFLSLIFFIGTTVIIFLGHLIEQANEKKDFKYHICKRIERNNKKFLGQNLGIDYLPISKFKLGIVSFRAIKNIIVILFTTFSFLVVINSLRENNLVVGITICIFLFQIILIILNFYLNSIYKRRPDFKDILIKVKELQK